MSAILETEAKLKQLMEVLGTTFSASEIQEASRFVDAGEYGVALETICFIIREEYKVISMDVYHLIDEVGSRMSMDSNLWGDLAIQRDG